MNIVCQFKKKKEKLRKLYLPNKKIKKKQKNQKKTKKTKKNAVFFYLRLRNFLFFFFVFFFFRRLFLCFVFLRFPPSKGIAVGTESVKLLRCTLGALLIFDGIAVGTESAKLLRCTLGALLIFDGIAVGTESVKLLVGQLLSHPFFSVRLFNQFLLLQGWEFLFLFHKHGFALGVVEVTHL